MWCEVRTRVRSLQHCCSDRTLVLTSHHMQDSRAAHHNHQTSCCECGQPRQNARDTRQDQTSRRQQFCSSDEETQPCSELLVHHRKEFCRWRHHHPAVRDVGRGQEHLKHPER